MKIPLPVSSFLRQAILPAICLIFSFSFFFLIKSEEKYRKIRYIYH